MPAITVTFADCATKPESGWVALLDGKKGLGNFNAFGDSNWSATDGAIQVDRRAKENGYFVLKDLYSNVPSSPSRPSRFSTARAPSDSAKFRSENFGLKESNGQRRPFAPRANA